MTRLRAGLGVLAALLLPLGMGTVPSGLRFSYGLLAALLGAGAAALPKGPRPRFALAAAAFGLALASGDLALRRWGASWVYYRPHDMFIERWERLPQLFRYRPGARFEGTVHGDLAAMSGERAHAERRRVAFRVDGHGFRNDPPPARGEGAVILLGDSFGVGNGTTQERTWASLLAREAGAAVYNLSMPGSPWQGYMNLRAEWGRLRPLRPRAVLWALFPGNDLDEPYGDALDPASLPWNGWPGAWAQRLATFQRRSPAGMLLTKAFFPLPSWKEEVMARRLPDGRPILFFGPYARHTRRSHAEVKAHPNFPRLGAVVEAAAAFAAREGMALRVVLVPSKEEVYRWLLDGGEAWSTDPAPSGFALALREIAGRAGLPVRDLKPDFIRASRELYEGSGGLLYWRDDTHWNGAGHALAARISRELIAGFAREGGWAKMGADPEREAGR